MAVVRGLPEVRSAGYGTEQRRSGLGFGRYSLFLGFYLGCGADLRGPDANLAMAFDQIWPSNKLCHGFRPNLGPSTKLGLISTNYEVPSTSLWLSSVKLGLSPATARFVLATCCLGPTSFPCFRHESGLGRYRCGADFDRVLAALGQRLPLFLQSWTGVAQHRIGFDQTCISVHPLVCLLDQTSASFGSAGFDQHLIGSDLIWTELGRVVAGLFCDLSCDENHRRLQHVTRLF